ncbi:hypothetical protein JST97_35545 [bacterium]|nr:hypothetical protein [bacterium]
MSLMENLNRQKSRQQSQGAKVNGQMKKKSSKKLSNISDDKLLERLAAKLESLLSPTLKVTWSGQLPDKTTGNMRQVDVVVINAQTGELQATMECRKRGRVEEIQWIHECIGRRARLNSPRSILLSSSGFSKEAQRIAADEGIELRVFSELTTPEQVASLFPGFKFVMGKRRLDVTNFEFGLGPWSSESGQVQQGNLDMNGVEFEDLRESGPLLTPKQFLSCLALNEEAHWQEVVDGTSVERDYVFWFCHPEERSQSEESHPLWIGARLVSLEPFIQIEIRRYQSDGRLRIHYRGAHARIYTLRLTLKFSQHVAWERPPDKATVYSSLSKGQLTRSAYTFIDEEQKLLWCFHDLGHGKWKTEILDRTNRPPLEFQPDIGDLA